MIFPEADRLIPLLGVQCCTALLKMQKATNLFFQHKWVGGVGCFFPLPRPTAGACTGQRLGMSLIPFMWAGWSVLKLLVLRSSLETVAFMNLFRQPVKMESCLLLSPSCPHHSTMHRAHGSSPFHLRVG